MKPWNKEIRHCKSTTSKQEKYLKKQSDNGERIFNASKYLVFFYSFLQVYIPEFDIHMHRLLEGHRAGESKNKRGLSYFKNVLHELVVLFFY